MGFRITGQGTFTLERRAITLGDIDWGSLDVPAELVRSVMCHKKTLGRAIGGPGYGRTTHRGCPRDVTGTVYDVCWCWPAGQQWMTQQRSPNVSVFFGAELSVKSERQFLERLRRDLPTAVVLANFYPRLARQQRQIDFFIHTEMRSVHVELKALHGAYPIRGGLNGAWIQYLPEGTERPIGNPFRQANEGTFAISDSMVRYRKDTAGVSEASKKSFETVVCLFPAIPDGSEIERHRHVQVLGYDELFAGLVSPGRRVGWNEGEWDGFLRFQQVYPERDTALEAVDRREALSDLAEYRARFIAALADDLATWILTPAKVGDEAVNALDVTRSVKDGETVALVGPSGFGKTHTAMHAARDRAVAGSTVIWAQANEYEPGALSRLIARATAPYTTDTASSIVDTSLRFGGDVVLIVDGLTGSRNEKRLIDQLVAMRQRMRFGLVLTSTAPVPIDRLVGRVVNVGRPDESSMVELLRTYDVSQFQDVPLTTPFEVATLAVVADSVHEPASVADIHSAYIHLFAGTETTRAGLRRVGMLLASNIVGSARIGEVRTDLTRAGFRPEEVDSVLTCDLLVSAGGRIRFGHERHLEFLAAEEVVLTSPTGSDLGEQLADPRYSRLSVDALRLEPDEARLSDALSVLADTDLYASAASGSLGPVAKHVATAEIAQALAAATASLALHPSEFVESSNALPWIGAQWSEETHWSSTERALFRAAGSRLLAGDFIDEVAALLDRTDEVCAIEMQRLVEAGHQSSISTVVAATYSGSSGSSTPELPATTIARVTDFTSADHDNAGAAASRLFAGATKRTWGRLYLALNLSRWSKNGSLLPELVAMAWQAGGYHLRLQALVVAEGQLRDPDYARREELADVLESFDVDRSNWALSSFLVEALSAAGRVEPIATLDDISGEIAEVLADLSDPVRQQRAASIYSNQFENEVVGPYYEAVSQLDSRRRRKLLIMAASAEQCFWRASILAELAEDADAGSSMLRDLFRRWASEPPDVRKGFISENVDVYLAAIRGLSMVGTEPPGFDHGDDRSARAWELIGALLFAALNAVKTHSALETWDEVMTTCPAEAIDALRQAHTGVRRPGEMSLTSQIGEKFRTELNTLAEWGVLHRGELATASQWPDKDHSNWRFAVGIVGTYGRRESADLLRQYVGDRELGPTAVAAIRELESRYEV